MSQIIGIAGLKQSGKSTVTNFLHGHVMKKNEVIDEFFMSPEGELVVTSLYEEDGKPVKNMGVLDLCQTSDRLVDYANSNIWPLIKGYSFADPLKEILIGLFEVLPEQVYGTNDQKNTPTKVSWEDMPGVTKSYLKKVDKSGLMTARELMQYFGTEVMRKIYEPVWTNSCLNRIKQDGSPIAVISDCRFSNEFEAVKKAGGLLVKLSRSPYESDHSSEVDVSTYDGFDIVIENSDMTIDESCIEVLRSLTELGVEL